MKDEIKIFQRHSYLTMNSDTSFVSTVSDQVDSPKVVYDLNPFKVEAMREADFMFVASGTVARIASELLGTAARVCIWL